MIAVPRSVLRDFLAAAKRCAPGRPRGPAPTAGLTATPDAGVTMLNDLGEVALELAGPAGTGAGRLAVPLDVLAACAGPGDGPVSFAARGAAGVARWADGGGPREFPFDAGGRAPDPPPRPARWATMPDAFPAALHEAGRTAARDPRRHPLHRVLLRGRAGEVVATDAHQALVQASVRLPWAGDVLVPAVPAFGRADRWPPPVRVGKAADRVAVTAGGLTVWLTIDPAGRFPDVAAAVPRGPATVVELAAADAAAVRAALPAPPASADDATVTLDAAPGRVAVRGRSEPGEVIEVRLPGSSASGPAVRVAVGRRHLDRALALGLLTVRVAGPDRPVVFADDTRTYLAVAREPLDGDLPADPRAPTPRPEDPPVRPPPDGTPNGTGRPHPPADDAPDPLAEAEALRTALADAAARSARLVAALKARTKERRALTQVYSSLKALRLGPAGGER